MASRADLTDWMAHGSFGIMVHYLVSPPGESHAERAPAHDQIVNTFDVDGFMDQFAGTGADWLIFTIGQNTGYYNSPNTWLDGVLPGHTSDRDLVLEIATRVHAMGKRFIEGVQWHALVPVDSTFEGGEPHHYTDDELFGFVKACRAVGGAVTMNLPISMDGAVPEASIAQMQRLGQALK